MGRLSDAVNMELDRREFQRTVNSVNRMKKSVNSPWFKGTSAKYMRPIAQAMKANSKSSRIARMIGVTTAKSKTPDYGARVGVIKNDPSQFPDFSAPALASVIEYGTDERFRGTGGAIVTGAVPTGRVKPSPFLRPAWDHHAGRMMKNIEEAIIQKVTRE